jgi:prefoldin subunit 5
MSSTLFARGINTQVGLRRRAEDNDKIMSGLKSELTVLKDIPTEVRTLKAQIMALEKRIEAFQAVVDKLPSTA